MTRPLPRFLLLGLAIFLANGWWGSDAGASRSLAPPGTVLTDDELLFREAISRGYHETDSIVRMRLARNMRFAGAAEDRSDADLVAEAIALRMHESDLVVRRRLVQKLTLLAQARGRRTEPTEAELQAHLDEHPERWRRPARVTVTQLYFRDSDRASARRGELPAVPDPEDPDLRRLADPLPIPHHLPHHAERDLAKLLGPGFARETLGLPIGSWRGPLASAYGSHQVFVHERSEAGPVPLSAVRTEVRESLLAERGEAAFEAWVAQLRALHDLPAPAATHGVQSDANTARGAGT